MGLARSRRAQHLLIQSEVPSLDMVFPRWKLEKTNQHLFVKSVASSVWEEHLPVRGFIETGSRLREGLVAFDTLMYWI